MTITDVRPSHPSGPPQAQTHTGRGGPLVRLVVGSLGTGALAAAVLVLAALPGATEHVTSAVTLLGFAAGWTMLAFLTTRMTSSPQRWAYGLAAFLGAAGLLLLTLTPGDDALTAVAWVWPPILLVLVLASVRRMRVATPSRARWLLYPVLGALSIASVGALVENSAAQLQGSAMAMPGRLLDVGGHRLHLDCTGTGAPTVVLESGLGGSSPMWTPISDAIAGTTRVCSYDRAGIGWSDEASRPQDSRAVTADLHRLLDVAGEHGPYVLVGHSVGGVYAMTYAARYPAQAAGLVLLDSASPRQFTVLPDYAMQYSMMTRLYGVLPTLVRLGVGRVLPSQTANEVPGDAGRQASIFAGSPRSARTARDEVSTYRRTFGQAQALKSLGSKPLAVVSAGESVTETAGWAVAQQQLAALSTNSERRTVNSSHEGLLDHPSSFPASVAAIKDVVRAVRTGSAIGAS